MMAGQIRFTPAVGIGERLRNASTFADMLVGILTENLSDEYEPIELLTGPTWSGENKSGWRYRVRELKFNLDSLMHSEDFTVGRAEDTIRGQLHAWRKQIGQQATNADWQLVAWEAETRNIKRRARTRTEKAKKAQKAWTKFSGEDRPSDREEIWVEEQQVIVALVFVDTARQREVDMWRERTGLGGGAFEDGSVPMSAKREYARARDLLSTFYAGVAEPAGDGLTEDEQRQFVSDRARGVSWKAITRAYAKARQIKTEDINWTEIRTMVQEAERGGTTPAAPAA